MGCPIDDILDGRMQTRLLDTVINKLMKNARSAEVWSRHLNPSRDITKVTYHGGVNTRYYHVSKLGCRSKDTAIQEMNDYTDLMTWLSAEAEEVLQIVNQRVTDRQQEYMDYMAFKAELDRRESVYKKLEKFVYRKALKITEPMWIDLNTKWHTAARRTRMWLWKLDVSLPGKLGKFRNWLSHGEEVLEQQPVDIKDKHDLAKKLAKLLQESVEYFKDAESWKTFFYEVKRAGKYEGEFLIQPQMDRLANRLTALMKEYPRREKRLKFEEYQHKILALRESTKAKLLIWREKLGQQKDVELMLEDYYDFVKAQQLFPTYNFLSTRLSKEAEVWRKSAEKEQEQEVRKCIEEENAQWKKVSEDIKNVLPNLEKGLENWILYNDGIKRLTHFLNEGKSVMSRSAEERQQHFSDTSENEEKLKQVNNSGKFLMEVCCEPIAKEIRQTLALLNTNFKTKSFEEFKRVEIIRKRKQEYAEGVNQISEWFKNAEKLMRKPVPCIHSNLKDHLQDLFVCSCQIPEMENDIKSITKTAQSLVKDSSQDVVGEILQTLNVQEEVIRRLRKDIPERIKYLKAMLPNVKSLETGISDLSVWLDKGDIVLSANKMEGSQTQAEERLEKHEAFFQKSTYQKFIVEIKNKVHQTVTSTKPKLKNVDFSHVDDPMSAVNQRFLENMVCAKDWEKKLTNLCRLWKIYQQKETVVENWLQQARTILQEKTGDPEASMKRHKAFFGKQNKILEECLKAGQDILVVLEKPDQAEIQKSMDDIKTRWKATNVEVTLYLLKLEFLLYEEKFLSSAEEAEKTLQQEKKQHQRKQNLKETLQKHKQTFNEGPFRPTCIKCLERMHKLAENVNKLEPKDHSLEDRYEDHKARWANLLFSMNNISLELKRLTERWKAYNQKLDEFAANVVTIQDLKSQYQKALRNMGKLTYDGKLLQNNLNELIEDSPESDTRREQNRLTDLLSKFSELQPNLNKVADKSTVFSKAYDFRDTLKKRNNWLDETQRLVNDEPSIDGLEDARGYLQEHKDRIRLIMDSPNTAQDVLRCHLCEIPVPSMAFLYCDICLKNLCKDCVGKHLSDESVEHRVIQLKNNKLTPYCPIHSTKQCELHCVQCDIPICTQCISSGKHVQHRTRCCH